MTVEELNAKYGKPKVSAGGMSAQSNSLMDKWAQRDEEKKPYLTKMGELGTKYGEELLKESKQAEIGAQSPAVTAIKQAGATGRLAMEGLGETISAVTPKPVKEALKPVGEVAGQALGGLQKYAIQPAANLISESKGLQKLATTTQAPEIAQSLSDLVNGILAVEGTVTGITGATKAATKLPTAAKQAVSATKTGLGAVKNVVNGETFAGAEAKIKGLTPEKSVQRFKNAFSEQMYGTQTRTKKLEGYDTDVLETISKDPRYHPEVDAENKSLVTNASVQNLADDITKGSEKINELFKKLDDTYGGVSTQKVIQEVTKNVLDEMNKPIFIEMGEAPFVEIGNKLKRLAKIYPEKVPRTEVWELRKVLDDATEKLSDSNLKKQFRIQQRKAYTSLLEDTPGTEKNIVKSGMKEIQKLIEARDFMAQSVNGTKLKGGRLGDMLRNSVAAGVGQTVGAGAGGALFGLPGAVAGYTMSKAVGNWLAKNTLTTAGDRLVLEKLIVSRPDIWEEITNFIKGLTPEEKAMVAKNLNDGKLLELAGAKPAWAIKAKVEDSLPKETFKQYLKRKSEEAKAGLKKFSRRSSKGMVNFGAMAEDLVGKKEIKPKPGQTKEDFIKEQQTDFELKQKDEVKGKAPSKYDEKSASGNDLSKVFTEDIYADNADDIYGVKPYDKTTITLIKGMKDNPTKQVMVYRAVPKTSTETEIKTGDWVTINPKYATEHAEMSLPDGFKIITKKVQANEIYNNGNSINEWGYTPKATGEISDETLGKVYEESEVGKLAKGEETKKIQKETSSLEQEAKKYNTPEDFVKAQYEDSLLHGGPKNLVGKKIKSGMGIKGNDAGAVFFTTNTKGGEMYARGYTLKGIAKGDEGYIHHVSLDKDTKIFDSSNPNDIKKLSKFVQPEIIDDIKNTSRKGIADWATGSQYFDKIKEAGYDGIKLSERPAGFELFDESGKSVKADEDVISYAIFDENKFKMLPTESELTEIWNKAHEKHNTKSPEYAIGGGSGHTAPLRDESNAPLNKLDDIYPEDIYSEKANRLYSSGYKEADIKALKIINKVRNKPNAEVTIYRAVPGDVNEINPGDWVTLTKEYAESHGESNLDKNYKIISKKVKASDIFTDANSIQEFGYDPQEIKLQTPKETPKTETSEPTKQVLRPNQKPIGSEDSFDEVVARERFDIPNLKKISFGGSDRDVYDLGDNRVLKIAKTARGLEQNNSSVDYYAENEGLIPKTLEVGKNYLVKEKILPSNQQVKKMVKDLQKLPFSKNDKDFYTVLNELDEKYGREGLDLFPIAELGNYDFLVGDLKAIRNWGTTKDGKAIMLDEGTLNGDFVKEYAKRKQKNLDDPDFREIYQKSKIAKKLFGDLDKKTMYGIGGLGLYGISNQE